MEDPGGWWCPGVGPPLIFWTINPFKWGHVVGIPLSLLKMAGSAGPAEHAEHNIMIHEEEALRIKQQIQLTTTGHLPEK